MIHSSKLPADGNNDDDDDDNDELNGYYWHNIFYGSNIAAIKSSVPLA